MNYFIPAVDVLFVLGCFDSTRLVDIIFAAWLNVSLSDLLSGGPEFSSRYKIVAIVLGKQSSRLFSIHPHAK